MTRLRSRTIPTNKLGKTKVTKERIKGDSKFETDKEANRKVWSIILKKEITITGKTVAEAVKNAVAELGAPSESAITYEVIEEGRKGLFGIGSTPAKIRAEFVMGGEYTAYNFVKQLLGNMNIDATLEMTDGDNDDKLITVNGEGASILIGHHGDTLDALQYITNLVANKRENGEKPKYVKISIDIEGYRAKREEALRTLARRMAEKVLKYKKSVMLEPMSPYERRIIHSEVQTIEGVSTNSIGSDNNRKVVMYLDDGRGKKRNTKANAED